MGSICINEQEKARESLKINENHIRYFGSGNVHSLAKGCQEGEECRLPS